jgi:hypothetical protein
VLAVGLVIVGIAADVTAVNRHSPAGPTEVAIPAQSPASSVDPSMYDVTFYVTGSSHSANMRYTLWGSLTKEEDNLDLGELARLDFSPATVEARFPPGSHIFMEVRNNVPSGDVACRIDYIPPNYVTPETRSAHGASVARCDVDLQ